MKGTEDGEAALELVRYYSELAHTRFNNFILVETLFVLAFVEAWNLPLLRLELGLSLTALIATVLVWITLLRAQALVARLHRWVCDHNDTHQNRDPDPLARTIHEPRL